MNAGTTVVSLDGPAGTIDVAIDRPASPPRGGAIVAHPHPLFGGTRDNKVVQTLARALVQAGYLCWRPNFRGVGASAGTHDAGIGETDDLLWLAARLRADPAFAGAPDVPLVLAGFSFGSFVQTRVASRLAAAGTAVERMILVGPATSRFAVDAVPADTLVIHGEVDDVVPLASVFDWARPQGLAVVVIPGADHFFHRRLPLLKRLVLGFLADAPRGADGAPESE